MSIMVWFSKLGRMLLALIGVFRRMLCCLRRRRRNSDNLLPVTIKDGNIQFVPSLPPNTVDDFPSYSWNTWDDTETASVLPDVPNSSHAPRNSAALNGFQKPVTEVAEPDVDFFQDMVPKIKKPEQILLRKPEKSYEFTDSSTISKRFAAESFVPNTGELEHWRDDEGNWEDSLNENMDYHADSVLKESKLLEREKRAAENLKKKQAREATRSLKKDHLATKIS